MNIILINNKGIAFTFDVFITVIIILIIVFVSSIFIFQDIEENIDFQKQYFLEEKTIAISDAIIKNQNENSLIGMSLIDNDKKRILTNKISTQNNNFSQIDLNNFFIKEIKYTLKNGFNKKLFFEEKKSSTCFAVDRFVIIDEKKGLLSVVGCYE